MHLCLIGCGYIASHHARILRKLGASGVANPVKISFASRDRAKAETFRATHAGSLAFGTYAEACAHPEIQAVVVCTPNSDHHETALAAIANGKHAIVEKPFAATVAQADDILAHAAAAGVRVFVAENHRYHPHVRWLEALIQRGQLGALRLIRLNFLTSLGFREGEWRGSLATMGGGVLIDGGIHWVNTLLTLGGGDSVDVTAVEATRTMPGCPGEDTVVVSCVLKNGAVGVLSYSWNIRASFPDRIVAAHGDKGSAYVDNGGRVGYASIEGRRKLKVFPRGDREGFVAMWTDFLSNLDRGGASTPLATGEMGRRDLAFVEAAYRALRRRMAADGSV